MTGTIYVGEPMTGTIHVGDWVRIERDETRHLAKGTWPQFRGRVGTVVEINRAGKGPTEHGVVFGNTRPHPDRPGVLAHSDITTWFKLYEVTVIGGVGPEGHADDHHGAGGCESPPRRKAEEAYQARVAAAHQQSVAIRWEAVEAVIADTQAKLQELRTKRAETVTEAADGP